MADLEASHIHLKNEIIQIKSEPITPDDALSNFTFSFPFHDSKEGKAQFESLQNNQFFSFKYRLITLCFLVGQGFGLPNLKQ